MWLKNATVGLGNDQTTQRSVQTRRTGAVKTYKQCARTEEENIQENTRAG